MIVENLARALYLEYGEPKCFSVPAIAYYLRNQVGTVNNLIFEDFKVTGNMLEITDHCGNPLRRDAASIFAQLFRIYYCQKQINETMNALAADGILSFQDNLGGTTVTRVNKNQIALTWTQLKKNEEERLDKLVGAYKIRKSSPSQVAGDDTYSPDPYPWAQDTVSADYSEYMRTI